MKADPTIKRLVQLDVRRELERPEARADPYSAYARLRRLGPVLRWRSGLLIDNLVITL